MDRVRVESGCGVWIRVQSIAPATFWEEESPKRKKSRTDAYRGY